MAINGGLSFPGWPPSQLTCLGGRPCSQTDGLALISPESVVHTEEKGEKVSKKFLLFKEYVVYTGERANNWPKQRSEYFAQQKKNVFEFCSSASLVDNKDKMLKRLLFSRSSFSPKHSKLELGSVWWARTRPANIYSTLQFTCGSKREIICQLLPNQISFSSTLLDFTQLHSIFSLENITNNAMQAIDHFIPTYFSSKKMNQR